MKQRNLNQIAVVMVIAIVGAFVFAYYADITCTFRDVFFVVFPATIAVFGLVVIINAVLGMIFLWQQKREN